MTLHYTLNGACAKKNKRDPYPRGREYPPIRKIQAPFHKRAPKNAQILDQPIQKRGPFYTEMSSKPGKGTHKNVHNNKKP